MIGNNHKVFEKRATSVNGVIQLVEKKQKSPSKLPQEEIASNKLFNMSGGNILQEIPQLQRTNSFFEELQQKKKQHQPTLLIMEKHFSIEESKQHPP